MFAISLSNPQCELWLCEVSIRRRDKAAIERMAIDEQRGLRARHGQRQTVPRAIRQPEREGLDACYRRTRSYIVQPHFVTPSTRLHLQVPATARSRLH